MHTDPTPRLAAFQVALAEALLLDAVSKAVSLPLPLPVALRGVLVSPSLPPLPVALRGPLDSPPLARAALLSAAHLAALLRAAQVAAPARAAHLSMAVEAV